MGVHVLHRILLQIRGPIRSSYDHGARSVGLEATVEKSVRIGHHPRYLMISKREWALAHDGQRVSQRVLPLGHGDMTEMLARRAVHLHVAPHTQSEGDRRAEHSERGAEAPGQRPPPAESRGVGRLAPPVCSTRWTDRCGGTGPGTTTYIRRPSRPARSRPLTPPPQPRHNHRRLPVCLTSRRSATPSHRSRRPEWIGHCARQRTLTVRRSRLVEDQRLQSRQGPPATTAGTHSQPRCPALRKRFLQCRRCRPAHQDS